MPTSRPRKRKPGIQPTTAETAATVALHQQMFDLALSGRNGRQIAAELEVAPSTVSRALDKLWSEIRTEKATALRAKWDLRVEVGIAAIWDDYLAGTPAAVHAFCRLAELATKMHGINQQGVRDASALADALLRDPESRRQHATQLRDELAEARARRDGDPAATEQPTPKRRAAGRSRQTR